MWERPLLLSQMIAEQQEGKEKGEKNERKLIPSCPLEGAAFVPVNWKKNGDNDNGNASNIQIPEPSGHEVFTQISKLKPRAVTVLDEIIWLVSDKTQVSFLFTVADMQTLTGIAVPLLPSFLLPLPWD